MSQTEKALARLVTKPVDFEWGELVAVLSRFGYVMSGSAGSSRKFIHPVSKAVLAMHQPHPTNVLKAYQIKEAHGFLKQEKHI